MIKIYKIKFVSYSGITFNLYENLDLESVKQKVKLLNKIARKKGHIVTKIGKGEWEHETPENAIMVSDQDGYLIVKTQKREK